MDEKIEEEEKALLLKILGRRDRRQHNSLCFALESSPRKKSCRTSDYGHKGHLQDSKAMIRTPYGLIRKVEDDGEGSPRVVSESFLLSADIRLHSEPPEAGFTIGKVKGQW
ncbi:unnamed protein product [Heligmosomoides polygyrus]|uniref:Uncharacterized protein n=1 Tax=Heligmosomoides polygyrus TaxID=6339 RepID=A0A183FBN4_HELPZ|nr:unnamed protein product [Heligmosomoides polygyrus]